MKFDALLLDRSKAHPSARLLRGRHHRLGWRSRFGRGGKWKSALANQVLEARVGTQPVEVRIYTHPGERRILGALQPGGRPSGRGFSWP
jgi:hypothetical protein